MNPATILELAAHRYPEKEALATPGERLTYGQWNRRVKAVALGMLKAGIKPGDRVALCCFNGEPPATVYFAAHQLGAVAVWLNPRWKRGELAYALREADIKAILADRETAAEAAAALGLAQREDLLLILAEESGSWDDAQKRVYYSDLIKGGPGERELPLPRKRPDTEISTVLYTSGTTGRPKGVARTGRSDYYSAMALILEHRWQRFERTLSIMPFCHTMGLHTLLSMVLLNGTSVILPKADPSECLQMIQSESITALYLVPTVFHDLVRHIEACGAGEVPVPRLAFAGAPMPAALVKQCRDLFRPEVFVNQYGCTEMLVLAVNPDLERLPTSCGRPALNSRLLIAAAGNGRSSPGPGKPLPPRQVGEILVDATLPQAFAGYLNRPEETRRVMHEGWYRTGDLGYFDNHGNLYLVGRVDDMIISGGENIYPREVEEILGSHPLVEEAAVFGLPDRRWGELVAAAVVSRSGELTGSDLEEHCLNHPLLAKYKRPRRYFFVHRIPKSSSGKILYKELRKQFAERS
ncbi:MAG: class I adenylate-forming enzyme family protein [Dethiobacteria bacterium]